MSEHGNFVASHALTRLSPVSAVAAAAVAAPATRAANASIVRQGSSKLAYSTEVGMHATVMAEQARPFRVVNSRTPCMPPCVWPVVTAAACSTL